MRYRTLVLFLSSIAFSCRSGIALYQPNTISSAFSVRNWVDSMSAKSLDVREDAVWQLFIKGYMPRHLQRALPVRNSIQVNGKWIKARLFVLPDYWAIGNDKEWMRMPLSPKTAQAIADSLQCVLPTRRIVDLVHEQSDIQLEPIPLFAFRDSLTTFYHHHLMIEGQRGSRRGLVSGIKKDVVYTDRLYKTERPNRVAIYGWHRTNGSPIQPLYTGHVQTYVDYSHGVRFVYKKMKIGRKWVDLEKVLRDTVLRPLITDEPMADHFIYRY